MRFISTRSDRGGVRYHHKETVTDATSAPLGLPYLDHDLAVIVSPGAVAGNSATVQYTLSSEADIDAGTAIWADWDVGSVTAPAFGLISRSVSAVRLVSVGASTWEVSV